VRDGLARALDAPVALGRAKLTLLPLPAIELERLVIGDVRGFARPAAWPKGGLASAASARAEVEFAPLWSRRIELRRLALRDVRVTAIVNEQGEVNWEGLTRARAAESQGGAFDLALRQVTLENGRAEWYDGRTGRYLRARRADGELVLVSRRGGRDFAARTRLVVRELGDRKDWPLGAEPIALGLDVAREDTADAWAVQRLALERGGLTLSGKGRIDGPERRLTFALDQTRLPLADVLALLPRGHGEAFEGIDGAGTLRVGLEARGPTTRGRTPAIRARALLDDGTLRFGGRGTAFEHVHFDLVATEQGLDVRGFDGRIGRSSLSATGQVRGWDDPRVRGNVRANLDLAEVGNFLPLADSTKLAGRADVSLEAAGRLPIVGLHGERRALQTIEWSGRARLASASASGVGLGVPARDVNGDFTFSPGLATVTGLRATLGRSDVLIEGTVERPQDFVAALLDSSRTREASGTARFDLRSRVFDGDELFPVRKAPTRWPRVRAEGTFRVASAKFRRFAGTRLTGIVRYDDRVVTIDRGVADAYGGRVRGGARFDLRDPARAQYSVAASAESLSADAVLSAWTPVKDVAFGTLQLTANLEGHGFTAAEVTQSLTMKGLAHVIGGRLAGARVLAKIAEFTHNDAYRILSFRDLSAPFRVQRGRVVLEPIALSSGENEWLAQGSIGLDGSLDLRVAAVLPPSEVKQLPASVVRGVGAFLDEQGKLTLDLLVRGTVKSPSVEWDSERTASRLLERLPGTIGGFAEKLGVHLSDSLATSGKTAEQAADSAVAAQQRKLEQEAERQKEALAKRAADELAKLFVRHSAPEDTAALDSTFRAPK
jgi:hypothetical protein